MAKRKEPPKPLFGLKHDFYASLDNALQQGINLLQAAETVLQHSNLGETVKAGLKERVDAFRGALMSDD